MSVLRTIIGWIRVGFWIPVTLISTLALIILPKRKQVNIAHAWSWWLMFFAGARSNVTWFVSKEEVNQLPSAIVISNHQSYLDIPIVYSLFENFLHFVAKIELFRIPVIRGALIHADVVPLNRKSGVNLYKPVGQLLAKSKWVYLAPEGTRSPDGRLLPFRAGPFWMSMTFSVPLVVVGIRNSREVLPKGSFALRGGRVVEVAVLGVLEPTDDFHAQKEQARKMIETWCQTP